MHLAGAQVYFVYVLVVFLTNLAGMSNAQYRMRQVIGDTGRWHHETTHHNSSSFTATGSATNLPDLAHDRKNAERRTTGRKEIASVFLIMCS
jgi:hypothetical protein